MDNQIPSAEVETLIPYRNKWLLKVANHSSFLFRFFMKRYLDRHVLKWYVPNGFSVKCMEDKFRLEFNAERKLPISDTVEIKADRRRGMWETDFGSFSLHSETIHLGELIAEANGYLAGGNINAGDWIIDIGTSDGWIASLFSKMVGSEGRVIGIEPSSLLYTVAQKNKALNQLLQLELLPFAIGNECAIKESHINESHFIVSDTVMQNKSKSREQKLTVTHIMDFDSLIKQYVSDPSKIKMIKIDVEGAELEFIDSICMFIRSQPQCYACVASYHWVNEKQTWVEIERRRSAYQDLRIITGNPVHLTTYIVHQQNIIVLERLENFINHAIDIAQ